MTIGRMSSLVLGLAGAFGLGLWASPLVTARSAIVPPTVTPAAIDLTQPMPRPRIPDHRSISTVDVTLESRDLHHALQGVLAQGTDVAKAARGFRTAEQFASVAYASRNTGVPFVVLKHRVLDEDRTLASAIRESRPAISADIEAERARAEARSTMAALVVGRR